MSADFNRNPYFDDYDEDKNFHRILFRPGFAVQARELTQLQTILQEQISRHGDHVFKNGSLVIPGAVKIIGDGTYIRLSTKSIVTLDIANYEGAKVENSSGVTATITTLTRSDDNDPLTLYISYTTGGQFNRNETLTITRNDNSVLETVTIEDSADYTGLSTIVLVERGVYFLLDQFVLVEEQKLVVSKYNSINNISGEESIGLIAEEVFVTPEQDSSLLDNAQGSTNQTAPGAHRYKIVPRLALKSEVNDLKNFNEIARIVRGQIAKEVRESEYDVLGDTLAKRTYEESGDYVIRDFNIGIDDHPSDSSKMEVELDSGKAYVRGYRIETKVPTRLDLNKARTTEESSNTLVPLQQGDYFHVKTVFGHPEFYTTVKLYSDTSLTYTNNVPDEPTTQIGTATARAVVYDSVESALEGETVVRVHLFNFSFTGSNSVADVKTVFSDVGTPPFAGEIAPASIDNGSTVLQEQGDRAPIYRLPFSEVSTVNYSEFNFLKKYDSVVSTSAEVTISTPITSEQFRDETTDFIVYVSNVVSGSTAASVIGSVGSPDSVTLSTDNKTATLDVSSFGVNDTDEVVVYATMFKSPASIRTKTPVIGSTVTTSATPGSIIDLGKADVYEVTSIIGSSGDDFTRNYVLDTGQRDTFYGISNLQLRSGYPAPAEELTVTFNCFSHSSGDFFVANSYGSITYDNIPTYTSETGNDYRLANCIDLRPIADSAGNLSNNNPVAYVPDSEATLDFEYYLPRKDKIVLSSDGQFSVVEGIPELEPSEPSNIVNGITLYNVDVEAYTFDNGDVSVTSVKHPRYKMKDIGELETRIRNLEYYTTLNSSEQDALAQEYDGKFKTSVLVDQFVNHTKGDARLSSYRAAVDPENAELRPEASTKSIPLANDGTGSGFQFTGNIVTLPYQEVALVDQNKAASIERIQPFVKYSWEGTLALNPNSDSWVSTRRVPDTIRDGGTEFTEAFRNSRNALGTVWGSWNTFWSGRRQMRSRSGVRTSRSESTEIERIGDRVVNRSAIPFIRSRVIDFEATGLKPLTEVVAYFDNVDVSAFVAPSGGMTGDPLVTDGVGSISGTFEIPNTDDMRFRTGVRDFELKDKVENPSTSGEATYSAQGVLEDISETFIATTVVDITRRRVSRTRSTGRTRWIDPLAQSFMMPLEQGGFVTSIDLFFGPNAANAVHPVTVQIRAMENGYPAPEIAPYGNVTLSPNELGDGSNDSSVPTRFKFESPVYLEQDVEYCFVVLTDSETLTIWKSILGEQDALTGEQIARQPYLGSLFKSQNNRTWTAAQTEDLKFKLNRAKFDTGVNGLVSFTNSVTTNDANTEADPYLDPFPLDPFQFTNGSNYIKVQHPNHSMVEGDTVRFTRSGATGPLGGVPETELFDTDLAVSKGPSNEPVDVSSYYVVVTTNSDRDATLGGAGVVGTSHVGFSVVHPIIEQTILPNTSVNWEFKGTSKYGKSPDSSFTSFKVGEDNRLSFSRTSVNSGDSSVVLRANLSSSVDNLSPYIDTKRFALLATENRVNDIEDVDLVADSDETAARYITKPVELVNAGNEVSIFFEANRPPEASIDVFVKVAPIASDKQSAEHVWEKVTLSENIPPNEKYDNFSKYSYNKVFTEDFNMYSVKIVMRSANEARVPRIRDLRAISVKS